MVMKLWLIVKECKCHGDRHLFGCSEVMFGLPTYYLTGANMFSQELSAANLLLAWRATVRKCGAHSCRVRLSHKRAGSKFFLNHCSFVQAEIVAFILQTYRGFLKRRFNTLALRCYIPAPKSTPFRIDLSRPFELRVNWQAELGSHTSREIVALRVNKSIF